ncbi:DUF1707 domain-containing protein [Ferrimicrobium sp.]|uniref:DUF1707 domain-containing protein n=1 Tax=Ferrimicrobium sp. TaxID=2926050 RepID=UPI00261754B0|nr:DUF1707 domain-containing protein [Ferrimicrobium sp.]
MDRESTPDKSSELQASAEDRERARALLLERFRSGDLDFDEYEVRLMLLAKARKVSQIYEATFEKTRAPFVGPRWDRRIRRLDSFGLIPVVALAALSFFMGWIFPVLAIVIVAFLLTNLGYGVQWLRYRPIKRSLAKSNHPV